MYIYLMHRYCHGMCHMGNSQMFPSRPRGVSEEKTQEKPGEKKGAGNYPPYTSRYVTSYAVISGDITSVDLTSGDVTAPTYTSSSNACPIQHDILLTYHDNILAWHKKKRPPRYSCNREKLKIEWRYLILYYFPFFSPYEYLYKCTYFLVLWMRVRSNMTYY
jgi:hypothetical protein